MEEIQGHICCIILLFAELLLELHIKLSEYGRGCCWSLRCQCYSLPGVHLTVTFSLAKIEIFSASLFPLIFFSSLSPLKHNSNQGEQNELNFWTCSAYAILKWSKIGGRDLFMWVKFCTWLNLQLNILDSLKMPSATGCLLRFSDLCHTHGCMLFSLISVSSTASGPSCWIAPKLGFRSSWSLLHYSSPQKMMQWKGRNLLMLYQILLHLSLFMKKRQTSG